MPPYIVLDLKWVWAFTVYYALGFLWGATAVVKRQFTVGAVFPDVETSWTIGVAVLSLALAILCQTNLARIESWVTVAWLAVVVILPAASFALFLQGSAGGANTFSSLMYMTFPFARFVYLRFKVRDLKEESGE